MSERLVARLRQEADKLWCIHPELLRAAADALEASLEREAKLETKIEKLRAEPPIPDPWFER